MHVLILKKRAQNAMFSSRKRYSRAEYRCSQVRDSFHSQKACTEKCLVLRYRRLCSRAPTDKGSEHETRLWAYGTSLAMIALMALMLLLIAVVNRQLNRLCLQMGGLPNS